MLECPKCCSEYPYKDGLNFVCPECAYEWPVVKLESEFEFVVKDSNGVVINSGDNVVVIKDLKLKGSSSVIKIGTKIKNVRIIQSADNHHIDCKVPGIGSVKITPKNLKKV